jgi:hypothetical protein
VRVNLVHHKQNERLCSFSRRNAFNLCMIDYGRLNTLLWKGVSFHPLLFIEVDRVFGSKEIIKRINGHGKK